MNFLKQPCSTFDVVSYH